MSQITRVIAANVRLPLTEAIPAGRRFSRSIGTGVRRAGWSVWKVAVKTHLLRVCGKDNWNEEMWKVWGKAMQPKRHQNTWIDASADKRRRNRKPFYLPSTACTRHLRCSYIDRSISRRFFARGLHSWYPLRRLSLTPQHRLQHLQCFLTSETSF